MIKLYRERHTGFGMLTGDSLHEHRAGNARPCLLTVTTTSKQPKLGTGAGMWHCSVAGVHKKQEFQKALSIYLSHMSSEVTRGQTSIASDAKNMSYAFVSKIKTQKEVIKGKSSPASAACAYLYIISRCILT